MDLDAFVEFAGELADRARPVMCEAYRRPVTFQSKADGSPVTEVDRAVERVLRDQVKARFPEHGILGEEFGPDATDSEYVWVIDPIDGTKAFAAGLPTFGCLIALCRYGKPVIGLIELPVLEQRCIGMAGRPTVLNGNPVHCRSADRLDHCILASGGPDAFRGDGIAGFDRLRHRSQWNVYGSGCVGYVSLARGAVDICLEGNLDPFDFCALVPVVEGAGGVITDWHGGTLGLQSGPRILACGDRRVHETALLCLGGTDADK